MRIGACILFLFGVVLADFCLGAWTRNACVFGLVKCGWVTLFWVVLYAVPLLVIVVSVVFREQKDTYRY
jgi:hypothetical protein